MRKIESIDELHQLILNIGKEFHRICTKNNIPYYMLGGTMLGAIRHKGFVPWDDDMDFGIPREYFVKAIGLIRNNLNSNYRLTTVEDNVGIFGEIVKIEDVRTIVQEKTRLKTSSTYGVFIDIFPLDYTNNNYGRFSHNVFIHRWIKAERYVEEGKASNPYASLAILISKIFGKYFWVRNIKYLVRKKGSYIANYCGAWGERETVPKEVMGTPVLYHFEDTYFYGVVNPQKYLSYLYGDYMKLPPEDDRHIHITNIYYKDL